MWRIIRSNGLAVLLAALVLLLVLIQIIDALQPSPASSSATTAIDSSWVAPSLYTDTKLQGEDRAQVIYGEDLVAHTAQYFGPRGSVAAVTNGMNCQNCHLQAGKKNWGNNYSAVYSTYPKFRDRSGSMESIYKRVSDCFERSLNGKAPDSNSKEYQAIFAYIKWLGTDVQKGAKPLGSGIPKLPYLNRAADPEKGRSVYTAQCQSCHGPEGQGQLNLNGTQYEYPPLWGEHSYNSGAGLYRLSNFAGFVYNNMPFNQASHNHPKLTSEEAWDVAAFVNSQPRPSRDLHGDWPDISKKPFDHPFGPYTDGFSETQHKYGPYPPIIAYKAEPPKIK